MLSFGETLHWKCVIHRELAALCSVSTLGHAQVSTPAQSDFHCKDVFNLEWYKKLVCFLFHLIHTPEFSKWATLTSYTYSHCLPSQVLSNISTYIFSLEASSFFPLCLHPTLPDGLYSFMRDSFLFPLDLPSRSGLLSTISPSATSDPHHTG